MRMMTTTSTVTFSALATVAFKGWYSTTDGVISPTFCPTNLETLIAGGPGNSYVDCCATSGCSFPASCASCGVPTACSEGSIQVYDVKTTDNYGNTGYYTYNCWDGITMTCDSIAIFEKNRESSSGWSKTAYWCLPDDHPTAVYRNYEAITTITSATLTTSTSMRTSSPATLPTITSNKSYGSNDTSAIAGGVIGGVVGLTIIAGTLLYCLKRQKASKQQTGMSEFGTEYVHLN